MLSDFCNPIHVENKINIFQARLGCGGGGGGGDTRTPFPRPPVRVGEPAALAPRFGPGELAPLGADTECYLRCYYETVGAGGYPARLPSSELVAAVDRAFDVCPEVES